MPSGDSGEVRRLQCVGGPHDGDAYLVQQGAQREFPLVRVLPDRVLAGLYRIEGDRLRYSGPVVDDTEGGE